MGLSSLLSSDEGLASIVKAKIKSKVNAGNDDNKRKATFPSLNVVKSNLDKKIGTLENKEGDQVKLPIQNLISGKFQPRKHFDQTELDELAESIRSNGILQPILVRPLNEKGSSYEIIAGERRWRAAQIVKLHEVPVIIRDFDDSTALGVALIENLQRSDLNIIEEAEGFRSLMLKFEFTQEKLSSQLGKSRSHIANVLRLLSLPNTVKRHISNGDLSFGHARVLVSLPEEKAKEVADRIIDEELSVRKVEKLVNQIKRTQAVSSNSKNYDTIDNSNNVNIDYLERELTVLLGLKVEFNHKNNNSGTMSIRYKTLDQIQPVIDKLKWKPK
jgi:ParB family chromosome partitioning protein